MNYPQHLSVKLEWTRLRRAVRPGNFFDERETPTPGNGRRPARPIAPLSPLTPRDQCLGFV
jgi:hypothetical protein